MRKTTNSNNKGGKRKGAGRPASKASSTVLDALLANANGVHASSIAKEYNLALSTVNYALTSIEKKGFLYHKEQKRGQYTRKIYFIKKDKWNDINQYKEDIDKKLKLNEKYTSATTKENVTSKKISRTQIVFAWTLTISLILFLAGTVSLFLFYIPKLKDKENKVNSLTNWTILAFNLADIKNQKILLNQQHLNELEYLPATIIKNIGSIKLSSDVNNINNLNKLENLKVLDLSNTSLKISSFEVLKKLSLLEINFANTDLDNIDFLKDMTSLNSIDLSFTKVTDIFLLTKLERLTNIDWQGTVPSSVKPNLRFLNNQGVTITGQDLSKQILAIGTGGVEGVYYPLGESIAKVVNQQYKEFHLGINSTNGSVFNINAIADNQLDIAIAQSDVIHRAQQGKKEFKGKRHSNLRILIGLHTEPLHLLCNSQSEVTSIQEIIGKKINIDDKQSGTYSTVNELIEKVNINLNDFIPSTSPTNIVLRDLDNGKLDCIFFVVGLKSTLINNITKKDDIKLVSLRGGEIDILIKESPYYFYQKIPKGTYKEEEKDVDVHTFGPKAFLITTTALSNTVACQITKGVINQLQNIKNEDIPALEGFSKDDLNNKDDSLPVPLHKGAKKAFALEEGETCQ